MATGLPRGVQQRYQGNHPFDGRTRGGAARRQQTGGRPCHQPEAPHAGERKRHWSCNRSRQGIRRSLRSGDHQRLADAEQPGVDPRIGDLQCIQRQAITGSDAEQRLIGAHDVGERGRGGAGRWQRPHGRGVLSPGRRGAGQPQRPQGCGRLPRLAGDRGAPPLQQENGGQGRHEPYPGHRREIIPKWGGAAHSLAISYSG